MVLDLFALCFDQLCVCLVCSFCSHCSAGQCSCSDVFFNWFDVRFYWSNSAANSDTSTT